MYVCLCTAVTSTTIEEAIAAGANSTKAVGQACEAGTICGRCRNNIRTMIKAHKAAAEPERPFGRLRRRVFQDPNTGPH
jgi:bacterioferritin-associated ferredoxin